MINRILSKIKYHKDRFSMIFDNNIKIGQPKGQSPSYDTNLCKEEISRKYILETKGTNLNFLDAGARDGTLRYMLGTHENLKYDHVFYQSNHKQFYQKYNYYGMDLHPVNDQKVLSGDICNENFITEHSRFESFFDVIYSNNVFEHLKKPWIGAKNLLGMLKPGGLCIVIAPFAIRYHEVPGDYFRFTHTGLISLFQEHSKINTLVSGYDIKGRRNNWQGDNQGNDICPVDNFGAWRENWFAVAVIRKSNEN